MKEREDSVAGIAITLWLLTILILSIWIVSLQDERDSQRDQKERLVEIVPVVQLAPDESRAHQDALAQWIAGQEAPLHAWLSTLSEQQKYGILPALPSDLDRSDIIRIDGKTILVPVEQPTQ